VTRRSILELAQVTYTPSLPPSLPLGEKELITAPLCRGDILPGVTRRSILELAHEWGEFKVTERAVSMKEVVKANNEERVSRPRCVFLPIPFHPSLLRAFL